MAETVIRYLHRLIDLRLPPSIIHPALFLSCFCCYCTRKWSRPPRVKCHQHHPLPSTEIAQSISTVHRRAIRKAFWLFLGSFVKYSFSREGIFAQINDSRSSAFVRPSATTAVCSSTNITTQWPGGFPPLNPIPPIRSVCVLSISVCCSWDDTRDPYRISIKTNWWEVIARNESKFSTKLRLTYKAGTTTIVLQFRSYIREHFNYLFIYCLSNHGWPPPDLPRIHQSKNIPSFISPKWNFQSATTDSHTQHEHLLCVLIEQSRRRRPNNSTIHSSIHPSTRPSNQFFPHQ